MVCNWIKETGLADLSRSSLCKYLAGEGYGEHFLQTLSTSTHGPQGKALPFLSGSEATVLDVTVPMSTSYIHLGCHTLRAFSAPYRQP